MRGADHAHVHAPALVRADRGHHAILEDAQQLGLHRERQLAELVEEQRAAVGGAEQALAVCVGARERPLAVAEQRALDQRLRQRAAVDGDERPGRARALVVQRPRDQLLAGAGGTDHQRRTAELRDRPDLVAQRPDDLALTHEPQPVRVGCAHAGELEAEEHAVADGDARARRELDRPGDRRRGRAADRAAVEVHDMERSPRARHRLDLEALRVGEPAHAELLAADVRIVDGARAAADATERRIATPQREPVDRHRAGHGQRADAIEVAVVEQPQPRRLRLMGSPAQPRRPAVGSDDFVRRAAHRSGPTTIHDNPRGGPRARYSPPFQALLNLGPVGPSSSLYSSGRAAMIFRVASSLQLV